MKIACLSSYRDQTEMAEAAISNILACEAAGFDVVCRPVSVLPPGPKAPCLVEHLENKDLHNVDVVIQHAVPSLFEYKNGVKNIGYFGFDACGFNRSSWARCCDLMDEIWVSSMMCCSSVVDSGANKPIRIIPYACDYNKFASPPEPLDLPQLKDKCVFYVIGEFNRCGNFAALFRAYYAAFSFRDDVALVVKTNIPGQSPQFTNNAIKSMVLDVKKSSHVYPHESSYPPIITIVDDLSSEQLDRLHCTGNIFVHPARGSSFGIHAYNAMGFGNPVILSMCGAYNDLINDQVGWPIPGQSSPCFGMADIAVDLYTGMDLWLEPNLEVLIESMRAAYVAWDSTLLNNKGQAATERIAGMTLKHVGQTIQYTLKGDNHGVDICDDIARY